MSLETAKIERRMLERASRVVEVLAPPAWTNARLEAWLDWLGEDADLPAAVFRYAESLVAKGDAKGLFETARARAAFRRDLGAAMLAGKIAISDPRLDVAPPVLVTDEVKARAALSALRARRRGAKAARAAVGQLGGRLQAVMDSILRCEGDPAACADPNKNANLARSAEAARAGGATDAMIMDAIDLAKAGESEWIMVGPDHDDGGDPELVVVAESSALDALAGAAWETGSVAAALNAAGATSLTAAWGGVRGAVSLPAFGLADAFDGEAFSAAVALLSTALAAAADQRPASLGLAGVADWLAAQGAAYDSDEGRSAIRDIYRQAASACIASGARLASTLATVTALATCTTATADLDTAFVSKVLFAESFLDE